MRTGHQLTTPRILLAGFALIILLYSCLSGLSLYFLGTYSARLTETVQEQNQRQALAFALRRAARERTLKLYALINSKDDFEQDHYYQAIMEHGQEYLRARQSLAIRASSEAEHNMLERIDKLATVSSSRFHAVCELIRDSRPDTAYELALHQAIPAADQLLSVLDEFIHFQQARHRNLLLGSARDFQTVYSILLPLGIVILLVIIGIAVYVTHKTRLFIVSVGDLSGQLRHSRHREHAILQALFDGVITADKYGIIQDFNLAAEQIFGYRAHEVIGRSLNMLMPEQYSQAHNHLMQHAGVSGHTRKIGFDRELLGKRRDGSEFPIEIALTDIHQDGETLYIATVRDITAKKHHEQERQQAREHLEHLVEQRTAELSKANELLQKLANHDSLTGLANRRLFSELLRYELAQNRRSEKKLALLYLDLDGFKPVNDELGHEAGDTLLQEVAARLRKVVRNQDAIARIGGDEFTVIASNIHTTADAERIAQKIIAAVNQPLILKNQPVDIGVSIGISCYPEHGADIDSLLHHADQAMYQAKQGGKNRYCVYSEQLATDMAEQQSLNGD